MKTNILFVSITRSFILRTRNVSDKSCRENQKTHFMLTNFFFENLVVYEIMWKKYCRAGQVTLKYGACALHAGSVRIQTNTQNI